MYTLPPGLDILSTNVTIKHMLHIVYTTEARQWMDTGIPGAFYRKTQYLGAFPRVARALCRQYVMNS